MGELLHTLAQNKPDDLLFMIVLMGAVMLIAVCVTIVSVFDVLVSR